MKMFRDEELAARIKKWEEMEGRRATDREVQAFRWSMERERRTKPYTFMKRKPKKEKKYGK